MKPCTAAPRIARPMRHRANLVEYEADVRAYGERLAAERRARGLPDSEITEP